MARKRAHATAVSASHWGRARYRRHQTRWGGVPAPPKVGDAVSIVPVRTDGRIVMVGQLRHTHGNTHWEVPAGRSDAGEAPVDISLCE